MEATLCDICSGTIIDSYKPNVYIMFKGVDLRVFTKILGRNGAGDEVTMDVCPDCRYHILKSIVKLRYVFER